MQQQLQEDEHVNFESLPLPGASTSPLELEPVATGAEVHKSNIKTARLRAKTKVAAKQQSILGPHTIPELVWAVLVLLFGFYLLSDGKPDYGFVCLLLSVGILWPEKAKVISEGVHKIVSALWPLSKKGGSKSGETN